MTSKELKSSIRIILSQMDKDMTIYRWSAVSDPGTHPGSPLGAILRSPLEIMLDSIKTAELNAVQLSRASGDFVAQPGDVELDNEQIDLLRTLYSQCSPDLKHLFVPMLLHELKPENARLITHCVLILGTFADFNAILLSHRTNTAIVRGILAGVDEKLEFESHTVGDSDLDLLQKLARRIKQVTYKSSTAAEVFEWEQVKDAITQDVTRIVHRILKIRYLRLKKILMEGENPEINTDKQVLVSRLEALGFRKEIAGALQDLDKKLYQAGTSLDFKGCMDLVRTIYEEIIEDAAKSVALKKGEPPLDYPKKAFNPWNQYLLSRGVLTADEHEVTQKLYSYLSNAGAHRLGSEPEQVRVTKNMVIELGLLIVGRIQNLMGGN